MDSHASARPHISRRLVPALIVFLLITAAAPAGLTPSAARPTQDEASEPREREFKDTVPARVPIKIKVRRPEKVKDLGNDEWLGDLEVEVKNTGTKPIYFLRLGLIFADVRHMASGYEMGYSFVYGRAALIDLTQGPLPDDPSIHPGESHVFKLHETSLKRWKRYRSKVDPGPQPKKIEIIFSALSHGDGTGYLASDGRPVKVKVSAGKGRALTPAGERA